MRHGKECGYQGERQLSGPCEVTGGNTGVDVRRDTALTRRRTVRDGVFPVK